VQVKVTVTAQRGASPAQLPGLGGASRPRAQAPPYAHQTFYPSSQAGFHQLPKGNHNIILYPFYLIFIHSLLQHNTLPLLIHS
jgi:hypothetical protein